MAKQLNSYQVNLQFNANTTQAKMQLQDLQTTLDAIIKESVAGVSKGDFNLTKRLNEAQIAASKLQTILAQTTNVETGKMDLTRFSQSLKQSNLDLKKIQSSLLELGPSGQKAFMSLAQSIVEADVPLKRTNLLVSELWTTLKNTARWQISSSALHAFMGTIQSAYGYAKDLNESLNDIRIVTGHNIEYMDKFAERANKAAKALNATTLDYTNASLIYYQQGLSDEEVEKRTDITVKMANVIKQNADIVSDQLTAIWNNFYDGSDSLEHYADAMVRLGADTASSSDEIAGGLEKFAAVANTIGLSFDNAAAALATITATTRQSEDVVGTSLKTIFARIQGLKLGETLEDGTTLNQYSQALAAVGVNIKDSNGQLKDMDIILDDLGHKWSTISKDQQVALAQQVAGIRQYNQLIALMDNFDFYQENIQRAKEADGSLQEQADIYAESWEAARDRVRAAAESIYDDLINDKFFISLSDAIAGALDAIDKLISSIGGLPGVIAALGMIFTKVFKVQMGEGVNNLVFGLQSLIGLTKKSAVSLKQEAYNRASNMAFDTGTEVGDRQGESLKQTLDLKKRIYDISENITKEERQQLEGLIEINRAYNEQAIKAAQKKDQASENLQNTRMDLRARIRRNSATGEVEKNLNTFGNVQQQMSGIIKTGLRGSKALDGLNKALKEGSSLGKAFEGRINTIQQALIKVDRSKAAESIGNFAEELKNGTITVDQFLKKVNNVVTKENLMADATSKAATVLEDDFGKKVKINGEDCQKLAEDMTEVIVTTDKLKTTNKQVAGSYEKIKAAIENYKNATGDLGQKLISMVNGFSSLAMGLASIKSIFDTLSDEDMSFFDKFLSVSISLSMGISMTISGLSTMTKAYKELAEAKTLDNIKTSLNTAITEINNVVKAQAAARTGAQTAATDRQALAESKLTKNIILQNAAWLVRNKQMSATAALGLSLAGTILVVVAAAAALVLISKAVYNSIHKEEIAAEAAAKAASDLGNAYDECREKYQQMIDEFNEYKDAIDALDNLTKGTQEYRDALEEANQKALELIQNNPDKFNKDDYYWDDNKLVIKDTAMSRVAETSRQETVDLQATSAMANANNAQAQANLQKKNLVDTVTGSLRNTTGVDKTIDAYLNSDRVAVDKEDLKDILNLDNDIDDKALVNVLWRNIDALNELRNTMDGVETSFDLASKTAARAQWSGSGKENTKAGKMALEGGGRLYNNLYAEGENTVKGYSLSTNWAAYEKMNNLNSLKGYERSIKSDKVEYSYYDENGEKITQEINKEAIQIAAATQYANDRIGEALDSLYQNIAKANKDGLDSVGKYLSTENFDNMTKGELEQFQGLTDDQLKEYGIDKQAIEEAKKVVFDEIDGLNEAMSDQITVGVNKTLKENIQNFGSEGKDAYISAINQIGESIDWNALSPESQAEAWNKISNINWFDFDAQRQAETLIKEMGGDVSVLGDNWDKAFSQMRKAGDVVPVLTDIKERLDKIDNITKDMKIGKILEKEDYDTLVNYNSELARYFAILSDGSAVFVGDPLDFQQMVKSTKQDELSRTISGYQNAIDQYYAGAEELKKAGGLDQIREAGSENVNNQLAFLKTQNYDETQISDWIGKLANSRGQDIDTLKAIAEAVNEVGDSFLSSKGNIEQYTASSQQAMNELAMTADTAQEAEEMLKNGGINEMAYNMSAMQRMSSEKWGDLDPTEVNKYADSLMKTAKKSELLSNELENNKEAAEDVALYTMKMNNGIEKLSDNFDGWANVLKKSDSASQEYYDAMVDIKDAMSNVLGVSEEFLSDDFIINNLDDIALAANGDAEAIDRLALAASKDIVINLDFEDETTKQEVLSLYDDLMAEMPDLEVGATLDDKEFLTKLNNFVKQSGMSVEQAQAFFNSLGYEPEFVTDTKTVKRSIPQERTHTDYEITDGTIDILGQEWHIPTIDRLTTTSVSDYVDVDEKIQVPAFGTDNPQVKSLTKRSSGIMNNFSSANPGAKGSGGKGGSKNKPTKEALTKKSDVVDRYKEITDNINDTTRALDKANKSADRLWGKAHLDAMAKSNKLTLKEIDLLKQKQKEAQAYLKTDKATLQQAAKKAGITFTFDEDGDISNYTDQMTKLYNQLIAAQNKANSFSTKDAQDAYKEATLDPIQEKINELKDAIKQYEDTRDLVEELTDDIQDKINEWQDRNYQMLTYEVEIKVQLDENDTKKLEYYFDKLSNNIYKAAEALGYLQGQFDPVISQLGTYENFYSQLNNAYSNGEISQENYIEGLQDVYDNTLDNLNALQDLDKEMLEYYGNTIDLANDELSKYTDHMEHLTSVLDHYRSIITLLGKDKDYDKVLSVLNGTAQTKKNNFDTSKQWYESLKRERDAAAAALASSTDEAEREVLQKNYDAILAAFDEAEEDMLSKAEEYGEALKEILTTKMEQAADEMNKQLSTTKVSINGNNFNISGWDALNDALDRMSSYQDEYLTKTNQIYEMNKLLNNVNQAIDKTNNQAAKNRYQQFTKEIEQLRDKDKLSQLELEIAQAKYKVLEAQIALEEAQNAKSTVRLQRDNEGNFGYVYTADQEKVNDAQQALADAENDLYNIRLDATNKYGQQKLQYEKELAEKLAELDQKAAEDAVYRETTYQQERALVIQQYTDLITTAGNLYAKAQEEDSRVVQDAWVNSFDIIKDNSNSWKDTITENTNIINDTFKEWQDSMDEISKIVGDDLKDTQQKVKDVTDESNKLYQEVSNRVIPALESELSSVRSATEAWAQHRQQLLDTIRAYEELLNAIQATLRAQSGFGSNSDEDTDWAAMMGTVAYGSAEYNQYKNIRDVRIANGKKINYDTTARVDAYYKLLSEGKISGLPNGKQNFTQLTDEEWRKLVGFKSGGYTGTWNDDGKLAFLHQKELVLNADDTENMLASIQLVRQIAKQLDFNSQQISTLSSSGFTVSSQDGTLEQNVRIEANFPNATDRYEIQEAFNTLVNVASQYANRK